MPRNITVKFDDGSSHIYQNAPDNITPEQAQARAERDFAGKTVVALDGGRANSAPPKPAAAPAPQAQAPQQWAQKVWDDASANLERQIAGLPDKYKQMARDKFFADPRIAQLRVKAAQQRQQAGQQAFTSAARATAQQNSARNVQNSGNFLTALKAGITRGAFGLPERLAAAGERFLPSAITGNTTDASYDQILQQVRENTNADLNQNVAGNILGQIISGGLMGGAVAKSIGAATQGTRIGRAAQAAMEIAPRTTKAAAVVAGGAAGGGAQAAGEGSDVGAGALTGAVAAPVAVGAGKLLGLVARPVGDLLGLPTAGQLLRRFTTASVEQMRAAADEFRRVTGAEPTLYELLPLADRNAIAKNVIGLGGPGASEHAVNAVRTRIANIGPEMQQAVHAATGDERIRILGQMADDMDTARAAGGTVTPDAAPLPGMERAARSPADLKAFQGQEAAAHMAPVQDTVVANRLQELFPTSLHRDPDTGDISEVYSDPELNAALLNAASSLRLRMAPDNPDAAVAGLTADDMTRVLRQLAKVPPGTPQKGAAMRAEEHVMEQMALRFPRAAQQIEAMRNAYAARARQIEGMAEGARGRTRESIPVETSQQARVVNNAFNTPEGAAGRQLGQTNALNRDFAGTQNDVGRTLENISGSGETQRALAQNLGPQAASDITDAAGQQLQSARRLLSVGKESTQEADNLDINDLGRLALALNPHAMPMTKMFALSRLTQLARMPEGKATKIVDMLFSQDPAVRTKAISLLNGTNAAARAFLKDVRNAVVTGQLAGEAANSEGMGPTDLQPIPEASAAEASAGSDAENPTETAAPGEEADAVPPGTPYGKAVVQGLFPEAEVTDSVRDPNSDLGRKNPHSYHVTTDEAVDVRPIPGMTFEEFIQQIQDAGYTILEAIDEVKHPSKHATGPHWHVVIG